MAKKKIRIACVVDADGSWNAVSWHAASDGASGQRESDWRDAAWEGDLGMGGVKAFYWIEVEADFPESESVIGGVVVGGSDADA